MSDDCAYECPYNEEAHRNIFAGHEFEPVTPSPALPAAPERDIVKCPRCLQLLSVAAPSPALTREALLREAIEYTAIPTLLVFAESNAGVREAIRVLRAAIDRPGRGRVTSQKYDQRLKHNRHRSAGDKAEAPK